MPTKKVVKPPDDSAEDEESRETAEGDVEEEQESTAPPAPPSDDAADDDIDLDAIIDERVEAALAKARGSGPETPPGNTESTEGPEGSEVGESGGVLTQPERGSGPDDFEDRVNRVLDAREAKRSIEEKVAEIDERTRPKERRPRSAVATLIFGPRKDA